MQLYTYYRSTAAYRVRIALHYKGISYESIPVNLPHDEQMQQNYRQHNPEGRVPTLVDGAFELGQSAAILEYLEEKYPNPTILPLDIQKRAWVRYLAQIIISDIHPLNNIGVLKFLQGPLGQDQAHVMEWYHHWLKLGFDTIETMLTNNPDSDNFCCGTHVTMADICLIPQVYNAYRFEFPMTAYPSILRIHDHCLSLPYFAKSRPEVQVDAKSAANTL